MYEGTVTWFDKEQGFGWIRLDDGGEVWVHFSGILPDHVRFPQFRFLQKGQRVRFDIEERDRHDYQRRIAVNVVVLSD
ncbi:MAG: cold shock domain-containing protein [Alicyclobacillus macrosporangiidus]|uniref:cold-shock protein n=1 Tax=Alicyclobacillus macrosporangiidus TaxID=392015 RepID=UPI0026F0B334|nr:cold shock domain-containing protein [Alicyclobacillus macrosporangiidus]MCL6599923.1 cold shock domain-containing protein [Alicyclobacillus macrosporangiidus]